jgi:hypothetical protein
MGKPDARPVLDGMLDTARDLSKLMAAGYPPSSRPGNRPRPLESRLDRSSLQLANPYGLAHREHREANDRDQKCCPIGSVFGRRLS